MNAPRTPRSRPASAPDEPGPAPAAPAAPAAPTGSAQLGQPGADSTTLFDAAAATDHLRRVDPRLGRLIDAVGPCRLQLSAMPSAFGALAEAIVYQQLTGKAAATIFGRVRALFPGEGRPTPEDLLGAAEPALRAAGLSGAKVAALKDLGAKTRDGVVPELAALAAMDDEEIVARLTQVRGVGRWTVEMLLIFRLGRADVLPVADYGVRKGFARAFGKGELAAPAEIARRGARWRPYRTVASWYLWRQCELPAAKLGSPGTELEFAL